MMMYERAILIAPVAVGGWERVLGGHTQQMYVCCQIRGGEMGSFIGSKMGRNNGLTFGSTLLP